MSADIIFSDERMWNVRSRVFEECMRRALNHSGANKSAEELLKESPSIGCLGLSRIPDRGLQLVLAKSVLSAAIQWREELEQSDPTYVDAFRLPELIRFATDFLNAMNSPDAS
jgi:hypothetical protein